MSENTGKSLADRLIDISKNSVFDLTAYEQKVVDNDFNKIQEKNVDGSPKVDDKGKAVYKTESLPDPQNLQATMEQISNVNEVFREVAQMPKDSAARHSFNEKLKDYVDGLDNTNLFKLFKTIGLQMKANEMFGYDIVKDYFSFAGNQDKLFKLTRKGSLTDFHKTFALAWASEKLFRKSAPQRRITGTDVLNADYAVQKFVSTANVGGMSYKDKQRVLTHAAEEQGASLYDVYNRIFRDGEKEFNTDPDYINADANVVSDHKKEFDGLRGAFQDDILERCADAAVGKGKFADLFLGLDSLGEGKFIGGLVTKLNDRIAKEGTEGGKNELLDGVKSTFLKLSDMNRNEKAKVIATSLTAVDNFASVLAEALSQTNEAQNSTDGIFKRLAKAIKPQSNKGIDITE